MHIYYYCMYNNYYYVLLQPLVHLLQQLLLLLECPAYIGDPASIWNPAFIKTSNSDHRLVN